MLKEKLFFTVRIADDQSKTNNGGDYNEWLTVEPLKNGKFKTQFFTSCDLMKEEPPMIEELNIGDLVRMEQISIKREKQHDEYISWLEDARSK